MMREMSTPVFVESKYETGRRSMCACTRFRISVIARCAAMLTTCDERERRRRLNDRRARRGGGERHEQVGAVLPDDVVDEELRRPGKDEPGEPVDDHQHEANGQRPTVFGDELPRFLPCAGLVILGHSGM